MAQHSNTLARRQAVQVLYQMELTGTQDAEAALSQVNPEEEVLPSAYASLLVRGTTEHRDDVDEKIGEFSENWSLERMPVVDRAILRLACFEMLYVDACPVSVAINEAVDLAKAYGGEDDSPRFVNGVLGRIADTYAPEPAPAKDEAAPAQDAAAEAAAAEGSAQDDQEAGQQTATEQQD